MTSLTTDPTTDRRSGVFPRYLNIACGGTYVASAEWENVDYSPHDGRYVKRMDVVHGLNPSQPKYEAIYCSHFIEHIPTEFVPGFLTRCRKLLSPGGVFRIVVPDAEFLLREYLKHKDAGNDALAEFAYVNFLDQCVRRTQGGRLGQFYREIASGCRSDLAEYATYLNGVEVASEGGFVGGNQGFVTKLMRAFKSLGGGIGKLERPYISLVSRLLPLSFREQNISFADVGELHRWMYDFEQLSVLLGAAGFGSVTRQSFDSSRRADGLFSSLDLLDGKPRKGHHQLFLEASV